MFGGFPLQNMSILYTENIFQIIGHVCSLPAGQDYNPMTQIMEFQPGETQTNITITIHDDQKIEADEQFEVYIIGGIGVHLSPFPRAMITIQNDDGK